MGSSVDWAMVESQLPLYEYMLRKGSRYKDVPPREAGGTFRGSSIGYMCPRQEVLCSLGGHWRQDEIDPDLDFIFACGNGIHEALQQQLLRGIIIGAWRCLGCGAEYGSMDNPIVEPKVCTSKRYNQETEELEPCPNHNYFEDVVTDWHLPGFAYKEIDLHLDSPIQLYSHPDGIVWRGTDDPPDEIDLKSPLIEVLELKSASWVAMLYGYGHGEIKRAAVPYHVDQTMLYMYVLGIERGRIVYVDKSGRGLRSSLIEHPVQLDREYVESEVIGRFLSIDKAIEAEDPTMADRACPNATCSRARECPVSKECWSDSSED